jgi:hypothetical protein
VFLGLSFVLQVFSGILILIVKIYSDKAKGAQIRSRIKWVEEGEKNTKFFLGLEKARQTLKSFF